MAISERLHPSNSALLVIDVQEKLMPFIHEKEKVVANTALLIKAANTLKMPILSTTQYNAKIGPLLPEVQQELGNVEMIDKMEFDCFMNRKFQQKIKSLSKNIENLILCGVEAHICVYQTALGGINGGFRIWIAADAVSSRVFSNFETGLSRIRDLGGEIGSTELIIYELLEKAGTAEFKALLPFIK